MPGKSGYAPVSSVELTPDEWLMVRTALDAAVINSRVTDPEYAQRYSAISSEVHHQGVAGRRGRFRAIGLPLPELPPEPPF